MKSSNIKKEKRVRRHARIRAKISGTSEVPRLSVFKSNKHISAQLIDDASGKTIASSHSRDVGDKAGEVGKAIADNAKAKGVSAVVFDRGGFIYTGSVKALAEGARSGGLKF